MKLVGGPPLRRIAHLLVRTDLSPGSTICCLALPATLLQDAASCFGVRSTAATSLPIGIGDHALGVKAK